MNNISTPSSTLIKFIELVREDPTLIRIAEMKEEVAEQLVDYFEKPAHLSEAEGESLGLLELLAQDLMDEVGNPISAHKFLRAQDRDLADYYADIAGLCRTHSVAPGICACSAGSKSSAPGR